MTDMGQWWRMIFESFSILKVFLWCEGMLKVLSFKGVIKFLVSTRFIRFCVMHRNVHSLSENYADTVPAS